MEEQKLTKAKMDISKKAKLTALVVALAFAGFLWATHAGGNHSGGGSTAQPAKAPSSAAPAANQPAGNQPAAAQPGPTPSCNGNGPWRGDIGGLTIEITRNGPDAYSVKITAGGDGHRWRIGVDGKDEQNDGILGPKKSTTEKVSKAKGDTTTIRVWPDRSNESLNVPIPNCV